MLLNAEALGHAPWNFSWLWSHNLELKLSIISNVSFCRGDNIDVYFDNFLVVYCCPKETKLFCAPPLLQIYFYLYYNCFSLNFNLAVLII